MIEMHPKLAALAKAGDPDTVIDAVVEPKLDGHRVLAFIEAEGVRLFARTGVDKTAKLPTIAAALRGLPVGTILDGEVVSWTAAGGDWSAVQSVLGAGDGRSDAALCYVAFDCLSVMGEDVRLHRLDVRRSLLETLLAGRTGPIELIFQRRYTPEAVTDLMQGISPEGVIVKSLSGTYDSGARRWIKVKASHTEDVVVMGATEGKGKYAGQIGALIFGQYIGQPDCGTTVDGPGTCHPPMAPCCLLVEMGQCSGMDDETREALTYWHRHSKGELVGTVIEVSHMGKMPSGGWRHPQFKRVRTDKLPTDCVVTV